MQRDRTLITKQLRELASVSTMAVRSVLMNQYESNAANLCEINDVVHLELKRLDL